MKYRLLRRVEGGVFVKKQNLLTFNSDPLLPSRFLLFKNINPYKDKHHMLLMQYLEDVEFWWRDGS